MSNMYDSYPIWHPYTQMQTESAPVNIVRGEGAYLFDKDSNRYIDAVSSWWTNIHGHAHPHIARAIATQAERLEQVIFAGFTHEPAIKLANLLLQKIPFHSKVFYSDNGSTAVEAALKMAIQYWKNQGVKKTKVIAFKDAYHGDTFGVMSISGRSVFTKPYEELLFDVIFIETPSAGNSTETIRQLEEYLNSEKGADAAAFIFEPLVLGSSGMLMYDPDVLDKLIAVCAKHNVLTIADEVMTGFGRTGKFLATDYCANKPDIICLSKGITGGFMPFAATTCTHKIYDAFLSSNKSKMLFHGHSYTGNPLGCACAIASMELFEQEDTLNKVLQIEAQHKVFAAAISSHTMVAEVRHRGTILAVELKADEASGYLNNVRDAAYSFFLQRKIILRPLGNVIYILPPYCISQTDLGEVYSAIAAFLEHYKISKQQQ